MDFSIPSEKEQRNPACFPVGRLCHDYVKSFLTGQQRNDQHVIEAEQSPGMGR